MTIEELDTCTLCGKPMAEILVLTEVTLEIHSRYHREDDTFENMNGLQKKTSEFLCEECLQQFVEKLTSFTTERRSFASPEAAAQDGQDVPAVK
ncbi:MAG: hypothetical protein LBQ83_01400 [Candidatus Margulisbacteria bacterium]|jgi:hypothetical protein|nr:hypothetical protein [Candidatus Margulisiibacteriota bacterium]